MERLAAGARRIACAHHQAALAHHTITFDRFGTSIA
jgi:hypothetical protein